MSNLVHELLIRIKADLGRVVKDTGDVADGLQAVGDSADEANKRIRETADELNNIQPGGVEETTVAVDAIAESAGNASGAVSSLGVAFGLLSGATLALVFAKIAKEIITVKLETESLRTQLDILTGDGAAAFQTIQTEAANTPGSIKELKDEFIALRDAGINPTTDAMQAIADQSIALSGDLSQLSDITKILSEAYAEGSLSAKSLIDLSEHGIPIFALLEDATGKNAKQLIEMAVKGDLSRESIDRLIVSMGNMSKGESAKALGSLEERISLLGKAWHNWEDTVLEDKSLGVIKTIVNSATNLINTFSRNMSANIDNQIAHAQSRINTFSSLGAVGQFVGDMVGYDPNQEKNKLDALNRQAAAQRAAADEKLKVETKVKDIERDNVNALNNAIDAEKKLGSVRQANHHAASSAADKAASAYAKERESVAATIEKLQFELSTLSLSDRERAIQNQLRALSAKATGEERVQIEALIREIDKETAAHKKQQEMWKTSIKDANAYYDLRKEINQLADKPDMSRDDFANGLAKIQDMGKELDLSAEQQKKLFDELGKGYNDSFVIKAKQGVNSLSVFSEQAARNMQDAFAQFLFDPFGSSIEDMGSSFIKMLGKMAAEAASAQVFEAFLGKNYGQSNATSGLIQAGIGAVSSAFGGMGSGSYAGLFSANGNAFNHGELLAFANGGVVTRPSVFPLAGGKTGMMGEAGPEAILPLQRGADGKLGVMVAGSNGGGINISTHVSVDSNGNAKDSDNGAKLANLVNSAVKKVIVEEKRPGGLLAAGR